MATKPIIKFKVHRQSALVGGKFYGVVDNADVVPASLTMQQIVEYKKLYNYNPKQLEQICEDVLQGAAELVARDGLPRNVSSLLKFEARIKGTFGNTEATVTSQEVKVAPRMLKDIRVDIDKADFEFANVSDSTAPKIFSVAVDYEDFDDWSIPTTFKGYPDNLNFQGALTFAGQRLCPNGWTADCDLTALVYRGGDLLCHIEHHTSGGDTMGILPALSSITVASENAFAVPAHATGVPYTEAGWMPDGASYNLVEYTPTAGDVIEFNFTRELQDGSGQLVTASKRVTLKA